MSTSISDRVHRAYDSCSPEFELMAAKKPVLSHWYLGEFDTGTIVDAVYCEGAMGMSNVLALVDVDDQKRQAILPIFNNNTDIIGRRIRAKLFQNHKEQGDVRAHGLPRYDMMCHFMGAHPEWRFFDWRASHIAVDDSFLMKTRNACAENLWVFGKFRQNAYYESNGYDIKPYSTMDHVKAQEPRKWSVKHLILNKFMP